MDGMTGKPHSRGEPFPRAFAAWATAPDLRFGAAASAEARLSFLDTLACMLAGAREPQTLKALSAMAAAGAAAPARAIAGGASLSVSAAALVNGVAAHALDYDDYEVVRSTHPSVPTLAALFSLAEIREVSLDQLLDAYLVGYEAIVRTGEALGYGHYMAGWHATSTIGPIGAAAACAKLAGLNAEAAANALSLAMSMSAGLKAQIGTDAKAVHAGLAARAGLEAALLAEAGTSANAELPDGPCGFLSRYGTAESPGFARPLRCLGKRAAIEQYPVLRKPWPCCSYVHRCIEAASKLAASPGFDAGAIGEGRVRIPEPFARVVEIAEPRSPSEARFSLAYCVAAALLDGQVSVASFTSQAIIRPEVRELMSRITVDAYGAGPELEDLSPAAPDTVTVGLADGGERSETIAQVKGGAANPLSEADLVTKFLECGGTRESAETLLRDDQAPSPFRPSRIVGCGWGGIRQSKAENRTPEPAS
jgi:2-methylcitrate dehydratase PrpD